MHRSKQPAGRGEAAGFALAPSRSAPMHDSACAGARRVAAKSQSQEIGAARLEKHCHELGWVRTVARASRSALRGISAGGASRMRAYLLATTASVALLTATAHGQDATWQGVGPDFNDSRNWSPPVVPTGTAFFGPAAATSLFFFET